MVTGRDLVRAGTSGAETGRDPSPEGSALERLLARQARRLGLRGGLRVLARILPWFLLATGVVLGAARLRLLAPPPAAALVAGGVLLLLAAGIATVTSVPSRKRTALLLDLEVASGEVISAGSEAGPGNRHPLWRACRRRAETILRSREVRGAFPLTSARAWRPTLLALAVLALVPFLPALQKRIAPPPETPAVVAETGEEIEKALEELRGRLEEEGRPESTDLMERLEEMADEMQRGEITSLEEALAALDRMETQTAALGREAEEMGRSTGFEEILKELAEDPFTRELSSALAAGERRALRRALERMAGAMTGDQAREILQGRMMENLASRLMEMSRMLRMAGESALASILREAAEAIRSGDLERARELLQSPALLEALEAAASQSGCRQSQMARDLSNLIQHARYTLGMGSLMPLEKPGQCKHGGGCTCGGAGPRPGKGSTNEQAGGYITEDPLMRDRQSDETSGMTGDWEALYESQVLEAESWEDVQASGKVGPSGEVMSEVGRSRGMGGAATLPLRPLAAPAPGRAEGAADLERVPPGYRDMVRRYFQRFRDSSPTQTEAGEP